MAYKRDPVAPMKIAVQAKLYTKTVSPTHVRDLYGTMQHEGATLGIMITTSGVSIRKSREGGGRPVVSALVCRHAVRG
jgi:restriction system protein